MMLLHIFTCILHTLPFLAPRSFSQPCLIHYLTDPLSVICFVLLFLLFYSLLIFFPLLVLLTSCLLCPRDGAPGL